VADPDESTDEPRRHLTIFISEFFADQGCHVTLPATWSLAGPAPTIVHGRKKVTEAPGAGCVGTMAEAMSRSLAPLAGYLALAISTQ
jgi:ABC-type transport auxiliary lipoprotein component